MAFVLYFNELSLPASTVTSDGLNKWSNSATTLIAGLRGVGKTQPTFTIGFPRGVWHTLYQNRPFSLWLKERMKRDEYAYLLNRIRDVDATADLLRHIYFDGKSTVGLTLAYITESWAVSFPIDETPWLVPSIAATEYRKQDGDIVSADCGVYHIANNDHVTHWQQQLNDWGKDIAENNTLANLLGFDIEMYPADHGYPHIHLVDSTQNKTIAKFRIDQFQRMEGKPKWDTEVRKWVEKHHAALMQAWIRCQKGEHPYRIEDA